MADRRGTGVLAVPGAPDDVAALVNRSATAARLQAGNGGVPGPSHAVQEPRADPADELTGGDDQRVAFPAVAPGQAARGTRPGAPRARSRRRAVYPRHRDRGGRADPRRGGSWARVSRPVARYRRPVARAAAPRGPGRRPHHVAHRQRSDQLAAVTASEACISQIRTSLGTAASRRRAPATVRRAASPARSRPSASRLSWPLVT